MKFSSIAIENFRNFESISIKLSNKNVCFGLNDVGKSNFIHALRLLLDKDVRKNNCCESDYYQHNTANPIKILLEIDISDDDNPDTEKLRAKMKGISLSEEKILYIQLIAHYDETELYGIPEIFWGGNLENLFPMNSKGISYDIDSVFNIIYIDSYVDMYKLFAKNAKKFIQCTEDDKETIQEIENSIDKLNDNIALISGVKKMEDKITQRLKKYKDKNLAVQIKSEIAVKSLFANITPYLKTETDSNLYPTAGDGRKKLVAYALFDILAENFQESKINLFFIEEPENHLHKSMQMALSKLLFEKDGYNYFFATTHSPYILYEMDDVNLIRIYSENGLFGASSLFQLNSEYQALKYALNEKLTEALFANKVLLIEGPSEKLLFGKVLKELNPNFEAQSYYILMVNGIAFNSYYSFLKSLNIKVVVKTDNDLRSVHGKDEYSCLGFTRCNQLIGKTLLPTDNITETGVATKRKLYVTNKQQLDLIRNEYGIYLSCCDLENDLDDVLHEEMVQYLEKSNPVAYLQEAKHLNMAQLITKLTLEDCKKIVNHYNFQCLKEFFE